MSLYRIEMMELDHELVGWPSGGHYLRLFWGPRKAVASRLNTYGLMSKLMSNAKEAPISGCLSHERFTYGAPGENRTHDLRFRKPSLYPLSYRGTQEILRGSRRVVHRVWVEVRRNVFAGWPRLGVPPALRGPQHGFSESHGRVPDCTSEWIRQEPPDGSG